jgi:von Willebrand factor type A domain
VADSVNRGRTVRALAVSLLLSLAVHGLLFLALGFCPRRSRSPALAIESTRITLETCRLKLDSPANRPEREPPAHLRGPDVDVGFNPRLQEAPLVPRNDTLLPGPMPSLTGSNAPSPAAPVSNEPGGGSDGATGGMFALPSTASSVVYVLDRSVSMGVNNKLDLACRELLACLRRLPASARFQVIAYNTSAEPLLIGGRIDLLPAEPAVLDEVARTLNNLVASGGTDHVRALRRGLALHPDVLFFVTDADDLPLAQVELIGRCNRGTAIHAIELSRRRSPRPDGPLAQLARGNGGTYRRVSAGD